MMPRKLVDKPFNDGKWSASRKKAFIISQLRRGKWPPRYAAVARAYVKDGSNPKTGCKCKLHKCESCGGLFAKGDMRADHRIPIVAPEIGFVDWNTWIERCFVEAEHYDVICVDCHAKKSAIERSIATERRRNEKMKGGVEDCKGGNMEMNSPQKTTKKVKRVWSTDSIFSRFDGCKYCLAIAPRTEFGANHGRCPECGKKHAFYTDSGERIHQRKTKEAKK